MLTVSLKFRRRTLFFSFNLVLPSVTIVFCTIFGFILPPESGEKIGLRNYFINLYTFLLSFTTSLINVWKEITNLLGVIFFLNYVSTIVPPSSMGVARISYNLKF